MSTRQRASRVTAGQTVSYSGSAHVVVSTGTKDSGSIKIAVAEVRPKSMPDARWTQTVNVGDLYEA